MSIRAERHTADDVPVRGVRAEFFAGGRIPDPDDLIPAGRGEAFAIGAEGDRKNFAVAVKGEMNRTPLQVPDDCFAPVVRRGKPLTIWAKRHGIDPAGVSMQAEPFVAAGCVPNFYSLVRAGR